VLGKNRPGSGGAARRGGSFCLRRNATRGPALGSTIGDVRGHALLIDADATFQARRDLDCTAMSGGDVAWSMPAPRASVALNGTRVATLGGWLAMVCIFAFDAFTHRTNAPDGAADKREHVQSGQSLQPVPRCPAATGHQCQVCCPSLGQVA
jgi:hypothetical protein